MYPRRRSIVAFVLAAVVILTVLQNLGTVLQDMHPADGVAGSITSIDKPLVTPSDATSVVQSWRAFGEQPSACNEVCAPPKVIAAWCLALDSVFFAPLLAIVLALLARRRLGFLNPGSWIHQVVTIAAWGALLYLALDELENLLTVAFVFPDHTTEWLGQIIGYVTLFKDVSIALVALPIIASFPFANAEATGGVAAPPPTTPPLWPSVRALRIPAVLSVVSIVVLLDLPAGVRPQLEDVVRTWLDTNGWHALWAFMAALIFGFALYAACRLNDEPISVEADTSSTHFFVYFAIALVGTGGYIGAKLASSNLAPLVLPFAVVAWFVTLTNGPALVRDAPRIRPGTDLNPSVARSIAVAPLVALGLLILRATQFAGPLRQKLAGGGLGALAVALAIGGWLLLDHTPTLSKPVARLALVGFGVAALAVALAGRYSPLGIGWELGSVAVLFVGLLSGLALLTLVEHVFWNPPAGALAVIGIKRAPIFTLLIVAVVLESSVDTNAVFHPVHLGKGTPSATSGAYFDGTQGVSAADDFSKYAATHAPANGTGATRPVVAIFVIASSGGGGRAQFWNVLAMNCLFADTAPSGHAHPETFGCEPGSDRATPKWSDVFAASGISGGSVGLAMYDATHRTVSTHDPVPIKQVFDRGFLDPTFTTMVDGDLPDGVLHLARGHDRARTLEMSWDDALPAMKGDYLASQQQTSFPILMLNSTDADDGCRINVSILELASPTVGSAHGSESTCRSAEPFTAGTIQNSQPIVGTRDVVDYVCPGHGDELSYSTAALMSARFPYVSPTGALNRCSRTRDPRTPLPKDAAARARHTIYAVDGGYLDTTAASPLVELLSELDISPPVAGTPTQPTAGADTTTPCYQPVVLQIDNGYADSVAPTPPGRPRELLAPIKGAKTAADARYDDAEQALAELAARSRCDTPSDLPTYLHVYPRLHPGTTAPLGWSLSRTAQADMGSQLSLAANQLAFCNARRWLVAGERDRDCAGEQSKIPASAPLGTGGAVGLIPLFATAAVLLAMALFLLRQTDRPGPVIGALIRRDGVLPTPPRLRTRRAMFKRQGDRIATMRAGLANGALAQLDAYLDLLDSAFAPRGFAEVPTAASHPDFRTVALPDGTRVELFRDHRSP